MDDAKHPRELVRMRELPRTCSYLPDETAALEYRVFSALSGAEFGELLRRGWRRHGEHVFRPACPTCTQCRSIRVEVAQFQPSKSQRRCLKRNEHVAVTLSRPLVTEEHVAVYNLFHADMSERRGWKDKATTLAEYAQGFPSGGYEFAFEMQYRDAGRLVGVGLIDITPVGISSIYFYHDPAWRPLGPGVYSALQEIELAKRLELSHVYLGYWIAGCQSMAYKNGYEPHDLLRGHVEDRIEPIWERPRSQSDCD